MLSYEDSLRVVADVILHGNQVFAAKRKHDLNRARSRKSPEVRLKLVTMFEQITVQGQTGVTDQVLGVGVRWGLDVGKIASTCVLRSLLSLKQFAADSTIR